MAQQTAVEWLVRKLSNEFIGEIPLHRWDEIRETVQQANKMFEKQIEKAWDDGFDTGYLSPNNANKYYNETYGK